MLQCYTLINEKSWYFKYEEEPHFAGVFIEIRRYLETGFCDVHRVNVSVPLIL